MHVGAVADLRGPAAGRTRTSSTTSAARLHLVPRYRQKLAFPPLETGRPLWVDDPTLQPRVPRAPHRAAAAGHRASSCASSPARDLLPAARPLEAALGDLARPGPRGRPLRADLEDPPRARRRRLGRRHRDRPVRPVAGARAEPSPTTSRGCPRPSPPTPSSSPRASTGWSRTPFELAGRALRRASAPGRDARARARGRRGRSARSSWAGLNPAPDVPLNVPIGPHRRVRWVAEPPGATSRRSRTRSAAPSTTSCSRSSPGALRDWLRARGVRTEGLELRALVPVSIRARGRARRSSATASRRCAGRCPSTSRTRSSACASCSEAMDEPEGVQAGARRRGDRRRCSDFAPPTLLAQASRLNFSTRLFNLIVTNVPGPAVPALPARARDAARPVPVALPARRTTRSRSRS